MAAETWGELQVAAGAPRSIFFTISENCKQALLFEEEMKWKECRQGNGSY